MATINGKILLKNASFTDQHLLERCEERGGYNAIRKALTMSPLDIVEEVKRAGLRGRGGGGFPTGQKWGFIPKNTDKPIYLICNADESEPGTFKDRVLMERDPHLVLEGIMIAARAIKAEWACIYIRGEYSYPYVRLQQAVNECYTKGFLGKGIFGSDCNLDIVVHRGAGAYVCGEETALLESLEGNKGQPRLKPPYYPAVMGLHNCPTVVNNVETYAALPYIIEAGAEAYCKLGTERSKGTKLVCVSGHIQKPGVYEIEFGYPLLKLLMEDCGGTFPGRKLKAVIPGGSSVAVLRAEELEGVTLDYESLQAAGSMLGSAGIIVMDDSTDMIEAIVNLMHFYAHESCGQCTPCREGGHWIAKVFERIARGEGMPGDLELIEDICSQINGRTICLFGEALAVPAQSFIRKFRDEFEARIREGISNRKPSPFPIYEAVL